MPKRSDRHGVRGGESWDGRRRRRCSSASSLLSRENLALRSTLASASSEAAKNARELEELRKIAAPIIEPEAQRVTLVAAKTPPQPQGKAFYLRNRAAWYFSPTTCRLCRAEGV